MKIRRAVASDAARVEALLSQVLEIHARIRPDIFISGTTKYTSREICAMFKNDEKPVYVALDPVGTVIGYAICAVKEQPFSNNMVPFRTLFVDDLCVDEGARGRGVGEKLFSHIKAEGKRLGCYEVTLAVWEGNDAARRFYEKMGMKVKESIMEYVLEGEGS
ncbi:MAG: GNAT family N-acetyltransferase [Clostridia bacterium]|nr:GNAT family N-acetyltransferase [Clostridia bacterium]